MRRPAADPRGEAYAGARWIHPRCSVLGGREPAWHPDAALDFYAGLFGWEFEDVMPPGSNGKYFIARLHGGENLPPSARSRSRRLRRLVWDTYILVGSADETASKVRAALAEAS